MRRRAPVRRSPGSPSRVWSGDDVGSATARYGFANWLAGIAVSSRPELDRGIEVEVFVEVELHPQTRSRRSSKKRRNHARKKTTIIRGSLLAKPDRAVGLAPLPRVQRKAKRSGTHGRTSGRSLATFAAAAARSRPASGGGAGVTLGGRATAIPDSARTRRRGPRGTPTTSRRRARWRCRPASTPPRATPALVAAPPPCRRTPCVHRDAGM